MRIQALPFDVNALPKPNGGDPPDVPALGANEGFVQSTPLVIYTYGLIGAGGEEPRSGER